MLENAVLFLSSMDFKMKKKKKKIEKQENYVQKPAHN